MHRTVGNRIFRLGEKRVSRDVAGVGRSNKEVRGKQHQVTSQELIQKWGQQVALVGGRSQGPHPANECSLGI